MYEIQYHPLVENDLKQLNNSVCIEVFKKIKKIKQSPQLGELLGHKNGMNLTGLRKMYVAKKQKNSLRDYYNIILVKVLAIKREDMQVYMNREDLTLF